MAFSKISAIDITWSWILTFTIFSYSSSFTKISTPYNSRITFSSPRFASLKIFEFCSPEILYLIILLLTLTTLYRFLKCFCKYLPKSNHPALIQAKKIFSSLVHKKKGCRKLGAICLISLLWGLVHHSKYSKWNVTHLQLGTIVLPIKCQFSCRKKHALTWRSCSWRLS